MYLELRPEHEALIGQAIQAGLIHNPEEVIEIGIDSLRDRLELRPAIGKSPRQLAVQSMQEFGGKHCLNLGRPVSRAPTDRGPTRLS